MSSDLFRNYTIPTITSNVLIKSGVNDSSSTSQEHLSQVTEPVSDVDWIESQNITEHLSESALPIGKDQYQHPNRFIAPGRQGTGFTPTKRAPKRRFSGSIGGTDFHKSPKLVGRDESYPEELNFLLKPLFCELCKAQLNSPKTADVHYRSKTHDKNINAWIARNYTEKGLEAPTIKRFYKCDSGPVGPDAYHCECCDLKLTSKVHAEQHYMGRKHQLVLSNVSNPSGSGYYTADGKWVRTGSKASIVAVESDGGRFGIGEGFKHKSVAAEVTADMTKDFNSDQPDSQAVSTEINLLVSEVTEGITQYFNSDQPDSQAVSTEINLPSQDNPKVDPTEALTCKVCNISVTSSLQMGVHLEGVKHRKKLKSSADHLTDVNVVKSTDTLLASLNETEISPSDVSMYRTPSGSFYCKTCNISMIHQTVLVQHLQGKKHIKKSAANSKDKAVANELI